MGERGKNDKRIDCLICAQKKSVSFNSWCNICLFHNLTSYQQKVPR